MLLALITVSFTKQSKINLVKQLTDSVSFIQWYITKCTPIQLSKLVNTKCKMKSLFNYLIYPKLTKILSNTQYQIQSVVNYQLYQRPTLKISNKYIPLYLVLNYLMNPNKMNTMYDTQCLLKSLVKHRIQFKPAQ